MTPTISEALVGNFMTLMEPPPPESAGEFMAGKIGVTGMIALLAAQEAEKGAAVRVTENRAMRALFAEADAGVWAPALADRLKALARGDDPDLTITGLDRNNAELRVALIALHTAVEESPGGASLARQKRILRLLRESADARRLDLPPMPAR
jgi:hypothetical protein